MRLGTGKKRVLNTSIKQFLNAYEKIKSIQFVDSSGVEEIAKLAITPEDIVELQEMSNIYSSSMTTAATGAAAGTAIALAASGTLPIVTGTLSVAGSALAAGEIGAAASLAGSALSFGAAMTPLAAIAAPVVLFTGFSASAKAEENLEKAQVMLAEAEEAAEKIQTSIMICDGITNRSDMFITLLDNTDGMFACCVSVMDAVIRKKEKKLKRSHLSANDFSQEEWALFAITRSLAGAVKAIIDVPLLSDEGRVTETSAELLERTTELIPVYTRQVEEIGAKRYKVLPQIPEGSIMEDLSVSAKLMGVKNKYFLGNRFIGENTIKGFVIPALFAVGIMSFFVIIGIIIAVHHSENSATNYASIK